MIDRVLFEAQVKLSSTASRLQLLRERARSLRHGWAVPSRYEVVTAPHEWELPLLTQRFLGRPGSLRLVDVGANTGYWAERFLRVIPAEYIAVEPDARAFTELTRRFPRASLANVAAGSFSGSISLHQAKDSTYSTISTYKAFAPDVATTDTVTVPVVRLDDHIPLDFNGGTILKIDVQGAEAEVLRGAAALLETTTLLLVETPLFPHTDLENDLATIASLIRPSGFRPAYFCRAGLSYGRFEVPTEHDVVFVRRSARDSDGYVV